MHEPQDNSRDYLPDVTASDDKEDGLILSLLSSKPGVIAPIILIPRRQGSSVKVRIPARISKSARGRAQSTSSSKTSRKQQAPKEGKPIPHRAGSGFDLNAPAEEEVSKEQESRTHNAHNIQYTINPHKTKRILFSILSCPVPLSTFYYLYTRLDTCRGRSLSRAYATS